MQPQSEGEEVMQPQSEGEEVMQPHRQQRDWPPEELDALRTLWEGEGLSAAEISRRLFSQSGILRTRSAICGKVRRIGLSRRASSRQEAALYARSTKRKPKGRRTSRTTPINKATIKHRVVEEAPPPVDPLNIPLDLIQWGVCRAVSDTSTWGRPLYCGHPTTHETDSFCPAHKALFFKPLQPRPRVSEALRHDRKRYRDSARWAGL